MKTLTDLFTLIAREQELNLNMMVQNQIMIDLQYNWISFRTYAKCEDKEHLKTIMSMESIASAVDIQKVYWTIVAEGRQTEDFS